MDDKWGVAWPMLTANPDPEIRIEIAQGMIRPAPCGRCSGPGEPTAHAAALDAVQKIRRDLQGKDGPWQATA